MIIQKRVIFFCISFFILSASGTADVYVETLEDLPLSSSSKMRIACWSVVSGIISCAIGVLIFTTVEDDGDSAIIAETLTVSAIGAVLGYRAARETTPEIVYNNLIYRLAKYKKDSFVVRVHRVYCQHNGDKKWPCRQSKEYEKNIFNMIDRHYILDAFSRVTAFNSSEKEYKRFVNIQKGLQEINKKNLSRNTITHACKNTGDQVEQYIKAFEDVMLAIKEDPVYLKQKKRLKKNCKKRNAFIWSTAKFSISFISEIVEKLREEQKKQEQEKKKEYCTN